METTMKSREDGSYTLTENIFAQLSDDYDFIGRTMDDKYIVYRKESEEGLFYTTTDRNREVQISDRANLEILYILDSGMYFLWEQDESENITGVYFYHFNDGKNKISRKIM